MLPTNKQTNKRIVWRMLRLLKLRLKLSVLSKKKSCQMSEAAKTSYHGYLAHMVWVIPWFVMLVNTEMVT